MKILKLKSVAFTFICIALISIFFTACQKNLPSDVLISQEIADDANNQRIMHALCSHMHNCENQVEITENGIIVDGDISMDKVSYLEYLAMLESDAGEKETFTNIPHPLDSEKMIEVSDRSVKKYDEHNNLILEERQRLAANDRFAKQADVSSINYYIRTSAIDCNYETGIEDAATYISNIRGTKINFIRTYSQSSADIIVGCDSDTFFETNSLRHYNLPDSVYARAAFPDPVTRKLGKYISINDNPDFDRITTPYVYAKQGVMVHEFLHCLGIAHTNEVAGWHMPNTPTTERFSIMTTEAFYINTMSSGDRNILQRVWPESLPKPSSISVSKQGSNKVKVEINNPNSAINPYDHIQIGFGKFEGGGFVWKGFEEAYSVPTANGNYDVILDKPGSGEYYFVARGRSHNNEVDSPFSDWIALDL